MPTLETVLLLVVSLFLSVLSGYGLVTLLWPPEREEYRHLVMAPAGYPALILLTHFISGTLGIGVQAAIVAAFTVLSALSLYAYWTRDRQRGITDILGEFGFVSLLALPMLVVVLWPLFTIGAETYQASVNPDFFLGLLDNEWLKTHPTNVIRTNVDTNSYAIFDNIFGTISESARYRGAYFAILLETLTRVPQRTALAVAIALFHFCMPISLYIFARLALGQRKEIGILAALLLGCSASMTLGYLSYYIGQASGLGFLGLLITTWFLCLTKPNVRILLLAMILTSALFVMYLGLMPYAGAPVLGLLIYLLLAREMSWKTASAIACSSIAFLLLVHIRMTGMLVGLFRAWASLATNSTFLGQYYIDYVTERFFPMFYGLTIYNLESSRVNSALGLELYLMLLYVLSVLISLGLILAFAYWICSANDRRHLALGISLAIAYTGVSLNYIFVRPYGYGAFKNATWLQFALVLFASVGIWWIYNVLRHRAAIWKKISAAIALVVVVTPFVLGNLFESWEYGMIGLGKDTNNGYMVVVHNMSGNHDYFELASAVPKIVRANESVGLALLNIAQQSWAMYYLRNLRLSYLGQYLLPGDDENLPDVKTRLVTDPYGNVTKDSPTFYHGATDDYYLVNQPRTINGEIVKNRYPSAVWENSTFKLVRASETPDFIFVARGFYRSEYRTANDYYLPQAIKWTAEGGELHILRAAQPGKPYRLAFTGLTGPGLDNARRTIEFFHNGQKFGSEKVINGFARIVSDPFYPTGTDDTIAIRIKEKVAPRPRPFSLWHRDLPIEYRKLNVMVSDIELLPPGDAPYRCNVGEDKCSVGQVLRGSDLFTQVIAFNGIEPNQWVREALTMTLPRPPGASALSLSVAVPGESTLRFPLHITVSIDGARSVHDVKEPGNVLLELPLPKHGFSEGLINLSIEPDQYFSSPNNRSGHDSTGERSLWRGVNSLLKPYVNAPAARPVVQSIRLESIGFK